MEADMTALNSNPPNIYHFLWQKNAIGNSCQGFCIPDTIIFQQKRPKWWYFMSSKSSSHQILRKNPANVSLEAILQAFIPKTSSSTTKPTDSTIIAVLLYPSTDMAGQAVMLLEHLDARALRKRMNKSAIPSYCILQKFIYPMEDQNTVIRATWTSLFYRAHEFKNVHRLADPFVPLLERVVTHEGQDYSVTVTALDEHEPRALDLAASGTSFSNHVEFTSKRRLWNAEVYFKVGRDGEAYMLYARELKLLLLHEHMDDQHVPRIIARPQSLQATTMCQRWKPTKKCPNCDRVDLTDANKFLVSFKTVIEAHDLPMTEPEGGSTLKQRRLILPSNSRNGGFKVAYFTKNAAEYLSRIERRAKDSRLQATRKLAFGKAARDKDVPALVSATLGPISKQKYVALRSDATFLYRFVHVCEKCSQDITSRAAASTARSTGSSCSNNDDDDDDDKRLVALKPRCKSAGPLRMVKSNAGVRAPTATAKIPIPPSRPRTAFAVRHRTTSRPAAGPRARKFEQKRAIERVETLLYDLGMNLKRAYGTTSLRTALAKWLEPETQAVDLPQLKILFQKVDLYYNTREWSFLLSQVHGRNQRAFCFVRATIRNNILCW